MKRQSQGRTGGPAFDTVSCSSALQLGLPCWLSGEESACSVGDLGLISGLGRCPGEEKGFPLQYSGLENSMDCIVHEVAKSRTQLSDFHFLGPTPELLTELVRGILWAVGLLD